MEGGEYTLIAVAHFSIFGIVSLYYGKPSFKKLYGYKGDFVGPLFLYLGLVVIILLPDRKRKLKSAGYHVTVSSFDIFIKDNKDNFFTINTALKNVKAKTK